MGSVSLRPVKCTKCESLMEPVWKSEPPHYLAGWVCDCCHTEPAILREKQFTRDEHGNKARSSGHMVQQGGKSA